MYWPKNQRVEGVDVHNPRPEQINRKLQNYKIINFMPLWSDVIFVWAEK